MLLNYDLKKLIWIFWNHWQGFKALSLTENINAMSLVASRFNCYNPLSQNSEHGLPTEERQRGRLIWSQSYRQEHYRKTDGEEGVRGGGWNGGIQKWHLWSSDPTWGNTITTRKKGGCYMILVLYCSGDPELVGRGSVTVGHPRQRRNTGLIVSSTLQAEPCVGAVWNYAITSAAQWDLTVGDLKTGTFGSDLPAGLAMFHKRIQTGGVKFWVGSLFWYPLSICST